MFLKDGYESLAVNRLEQMHHLVDDDLFEEVLRFFNEFRVEANVRSFANYLVSILFHCGKLSLLPVSPRPSGCH